MSCHSSNVKYMRLSKSALYPPFAAAACIHDTRYRREHNIFSVPGRLRRPSFPRRAPAAPLRHLVGRLRRPKISSPRTLPNPRFFLRSGGLPRFFLRICRTTAGKKKTISYRHTLPTWKFGRLSDVLLELW